MREKMSYLAIIAALLGVVACLPLEVKAAGPGISVRLLIDANARPMNIDAVSFTENVTGPPEHKAGTVKSYHSIFVLQFTKAVDVNSADLRAMAANGTQLPGVTIELTMPGNPEKPLLRLTIENVVISSVSMASPASTGLSISSSSGALETYALALNPDSSTVKWECWAYDLQGNSIRYDLFDYDYKSFK